MSKRKSLLALIGTVVLLVSLSVPLMQCAPAAEEEVTPPPEEEIKYGGKLDAGFFSGETIETLRCDSGWQYISMGCVFWPLIYDQLWIMGPAPDYEPLPMLATSWETEDSKTWIFHIRDDATFHDGVPVTAEDVVFMLEYLPGADPSWLYDYTDFVPGTVKAVADYTVQFTLKKVHTSTYPPLYWFPVLPKHIWEPYKDDMLSFSNDEAIGSGPFKLKEFKPAEYIWFEANKDYWGGRPYVDEVVFKVYGSSDALYMALRSGELDMIGYAGCTKLVVDDFEKTENMKVFASPGMRLYWLTFNLYKDTPLQNPDVRKAVMYGIDRDKIIDMVYLGYAQKIDSWMYPESADHNPNLPQYDYDPDKANEILDGAGYLDTDGDGIRNDPETGKNFALEIIVPSNWTDEVKTATMIAEQLAGIGIDMHLGVLDLSTYYSYIYGPKEGMCDIAIGMEAPGPYADWVWEFARSYDAGGEGWNQAYYNSPEFDELLDKMLAERDLTKRREYVYEMQEVLNDDLPYGFLLRVDKTNPVRTDEFEGYVETMGGISNWINPWTYFKVHLK